MLVNNAARFLMKPATETGEDEWDELFRVNVRGRVHPLTRGNGGPERAR